MEAKIRALFLAVLLLAVGEGWLVWGRGERPVEVRAVLGSPDLSDARVVDLDLSVVFVGGTMAVALDRGHAVLGGYLSNPLRAVGELCVRERGSSRHVGWECIPPGAMFNIEPTNGPVEVTAADTHHEFTGYGYVRKDGVR